MGLYYRTVNYGPLFSRRHNAEKRRHNAEKRAMGIPKRMATGNHPFRTVPFFYWRRQLTLFDPYKRKRSWRNMHSKTVYYSDSDGLRKGSVLVLQGSHMPSNRTILEQDRAPQR